MTVNFNFNGCFKGCSVSFPCCKTKKEEEPTPPDETLGPAFTRAQAQMLKLLLKGNTEGKAPSKKKEDQLLQRMMENAQLYNEFQTSFNTLKTEIREPDDTSRRESMLETFSNLFEGLPKITSNDNRLSNFDPNRINDCLKHAPISPSLNTRERQDIIQSVKRTLREESVRVISSKRLTTILMNELVKKGKIVLQPAINASEFEDIPRDIKRLTREQRKNLLNRQLAALLSNAQDRAKNPVLQHGASLLTASEEDGITPASPTPSEEDGITLASTPPSEENGIFQIMMSLV